MTFEQFALLYVVFALILFAHAARHQDDPFWRGFLWRK